MNTTILTAAALGLLLAASAASAQSQRGAGLARLDSDADQRLSREEAALAPRLAQQFALIDSNRDGLLERGELEAYAAERRALRKAAQKLRFAQLDADKDGFLAGSELVERPRLERRDINGDGRVDLAEFSQPPRGLGGWRHCGR
jgi:Ca2+-binding EF-hand superfamily protein